MWQFWVDRGGTFTDVVGRKPDGTLLTHKLLSENPERYKDAAVQGVRELLGLEVGTPLPEATISAVKMGTTVATNALLERKGDPMLLLITEGFRDLLRIGYQNRPRLFDLKIVLPELLYTEAAEVSERHDAQGGVVRELDEDAARVALRGAYDKGIRGVAIAFMHAYLNPAHEQIVAQIAREIGYTQVSTSHETSKLIKLIGRGDTAVVDAYLSPILRRYVEQVAEALDVERGACERLFFMQSSGGLTDARLFQGKDAILSGPAGGVVGMVKTAALAGFDKVIGFDMGGTSTDVTHFAGEYERSFETEVAGVRMRAPMMNIHTVAAGGGSILSFRDGRYQVGPESAGADPGPDGDQPLDAEIVREKFGVLAEQIAGETNGALLSPEDTAEGFLRIAVENMANAIKKISVQRGYDVTRYTLNCFGGAGGQHACLVADALGMKSVFIHPFTGVLSAYGMGLAEIRALREEQFDKIVSDVHTATKVLSRLAAEAMEEVASQGVDTARIHVEKRAYLRYAGSHQPLAVDFGSEREMRTRFDAAHTARFGFASPSRDLLIEILSVEAIGEAEDIADIAVAEDDARPEPIAQVRLVAEGEPCDAPLYDRIQLSPGQHVNGPAIITEPTGTNIIEPGWRGRIDAYGNLILDRVVEKRREVAIGTQADPVMLEVFNNLFMSIAEQMGETLANTAYSVNIKERFDFSCALFDAQGDLVANAPHVPVHLGSMSESVRIISRLNAGTMHPGDSIMLNAPFNGGTHLPDVTVITPVFDEDGETILFYVGSRGHHADIGGRTPGSAPPDSKHIDEEGVLIDNFKLVDRGRLREAEARALLASGKYPCRNIDENMADLEAQVAANATGIREVERMIANFGLDVVQAYMRHVQANAEMSVRRVIGSLTDGECIYPLDEGLEIRVKVTVDTDAGEAVIDFTGTSEHSPFNYNAPLAVCHAVVLYVFRTLVGSDIPLNEGCLKPLKIIAPEGSMINAQYPAAVIAGNTEVSQSIADCLYGALNAVAGSQGTVNNFVWGNDRFQNYETIGGGAGAGVGFAGASAVHTHMTNTRLTDPEVLETRFPVRVERFGIRSGSGGAGQWSGGEGILRDVRFLEAVTVTTLSSHRVTRPRGMQGGEDGAVGENAVVRERGDREVLKGNDQCALEPGDVFVMLTPGGGGWGKG